MSENVSLKGVVEHACSGLNRMSDDSPMRFVILDVLWMMAFEEDKQLEQQAALGFPRDLRILCNPVFMLLAANHKDVFNELMEHDISDTFDVTLSIVDALSDE